MPSFLTLEDATFKVVAFCQVTEDFKHEIPAMMFLQTHAKGGSYGASARGFKKLFERYADGGRAKLPGDVFHEVDKPNGIWEFIKGDLRLFCFFDGATVVLSHGAIKKSQKVDPSEVSRAVSCKTQYFKK